MKHREESWKYDAQGSSFDELRSVSSGDGTQPCPMLDITFQTKWLEKEKLRIEKIAVFHLISKHSLNITSFVFSLWIINEFEKFMESTTYKVAIMNYTHVGLTLFCCLNISFLSLWTSC